MRLAIFGAEHWHVPLYVGAVADAGCEVVAYSLSEPVEAVARLFPAAIGYRSDEDLLEAEKVDFGLVFGRHDRMLARCRMLVERGIGFSVEKPLSLDVGALTSLREEAARRGVFVSVALPYRAEGVEVAREFARSETPLHLGIRNIAGPTERYLKNGNPWLLQRAPAFGGCMINLGPHFIDIANWIARSPVETVQGTRLRFTPGCEVDEFATVTITYGSGFVAHVECGYTFPSTVAYSTEVNREFYIALSSRDDYKLAAADRMTTVRRLGREAGIDRMFRGEMDERPIDLQTDNFFRPYATETFARFAAGGAPVAGLDELLAVNEVIARWDAVAVWAGEARPPAPQAATLS